MYGFTRSVVQRTTVSTRRILGTVDSHITSCQPMLCPSLTCSTVVHHEKPLMDGEFNARTAAEYLSNLNDYEKKKLEIIKLEYELMLAKGSTVPMVMKDEWWATMLHKSRKQRLKLLRYFASMYYAKKHKEEKKLQRQLLSKEIEQQPKNNEPIIFFKHYPESYFSQFNFSKLSRSMLFGRPFIIDMSYEHQMESKETRTLIDQLLQGYSLNKCRSEPYDLMFTNLNIDSYIKKAMDYTYRYSSISKTLFAKTTERSYLDLFPRDKLVYLSPDADTVLWNDHPDNIYIMGGHADRLIKPVSRIKAKQEDLRCARLPLDELVLMKQGSKVLTCNCFMNIMFEFMDTNDWRKALRYLPKRKIVDLSRL